MVDHLDEGGAPCARHPDLAGARLYELAIIGSRAPGFHHDCASKLQSLMMALDEIGELAAQSDPELQLATNMANTALRDLHALLTTNRALAKPPHRARISLDELIRAASERVGVRVNGALSGDVEVVVPAMTHGLSLVLDLLAGPIHLGRTVEAQLALGDRATLDLSGPQEALTTPAISASEVIAIATFVVERDGGELRCKREGNAIVVRLPIKS